MLFPYGFLLIGFQLSLEQTLFQIAAPVVEVNSDNFVFRP